MKCASTPSSAIRELRLCEKEGFKPDLFLYSSLIHKLSSFSDTQNLTRIKEQTQESTMMLDGLRLFIEMKFKYDIKPNQVTLSALLNILFKQQYYCDIILLFNYFMKINKKSNTKSLKSFEKEILKQSIIDLKLCNFNVLYQKDENFPTKLSQRWNYHVMENNKHFSKISLFSSQFMALFLHFDNLSPKFAVGSKYNFSQFLQNTPGISLTDYQETTLYEFKNVFNQCLLDIGEPNSIVFNTVIKTLGQFGKIDAMTDLFQSMIGKHKVRPDTVTLNTIVHGLAIQCSSSSLSSNDNDQQTDNQENELQIEEEEEEEETQKQMNDNYGDGINSTNEKIISKIESLFDWWLDNSSKMLNDQLPDIVTINSMLKAYSRSKNWDKAIALFEKYCVQNEKNNINTQSEESGKENIKLKLDPTSLTFCSLLVCAAKCKRFEEALDIYSRLKIEFGMNDDNGFLGVLAMAACEEAQEYKQALIVFEGIRKESFDTRKLYKMDEAFVIALRCLFKGGHLKEALELFQEGVEQGYFKYLAHRFAIDPYADDDDDETEDERTSSIVDGLQSEMATAGGNHVDKQKTKQETTKKTKKRGKTKHYNMDLHGYDSIYAIVAIMYNLSNLIDTVEKVDTFKIPTIHIITGRGIGRRKELYLRTKDDNQVQELSTQVRDFSSLKEDLVAFLKDERLFNPVIQCHVDGDVTKAHMGRIRLDDRSVVNYIAKQLNQNPRKLLSKHTNASKLLSSNL